MPQPTATLALPDGRTLAYDDVGDPDGWPVVYVHGTPDSRLARHPDDGVAASLGIRLLAVDRPGFGHSSAHPQGTQRSWADDVAALLYTLGIGRCATLGWSAGAVGALAVAAAHPSRVAAVGIAAGLPPFSAYAETGVLEGADAGRQMLAELGAEFGPVGAAEMLAPYLVPDPIDIDLAREHVQQSADPVRLAELASVAGSVDVMAQALIDAGRQGLAGVTRDLELQILEPDVDLSLVACPVTLWYGSADTTAPPAFGRWYQSHLRDASLVVLEGAGHMLLLPHWASCLTTLHASAKRT